MAAVRWKVVEHRKSACYLLTSALMLLSISETHGYQWQWSDRLRWRYSNRTIAESASEDQSVESIRSIQDGDSSVPTLQEFLPLRGNPAPLAPVLPTSICEGATFCENVPEYPIEIINREIKKHPEHLRYALVDKVYRVAQKADAAEPEALCISTERVVYPKSGETAGKDWLFIINSANFSQGVRIETCVQEDSTCQVIDGFAQGYTTACKQKYIYRQLSAVAADGSITREYFRFPASCCCHVQFTGEELINDNS